MDRSETPLHIYAKYTGAGQLDANAIQLLIRQGANLDAIDANGRKCLHCAARRLDYLKMRTLLQCGVDAGDVFTNGNLGYEDSRCYFSDLTP